MADALLDLAALQVVADGQTGLTSLTNNDTTSNRTEIRALLVSTALRPVELHRVLLIVRATYQTTKSCDSDDAERVRDWILDQIQPSRIPPNDLLSTADASAWGLAGDVALRVLLKIDEAQTSPSLDFLLYQIATIIFWSSSDEPWITKESILMAKGLLSIMTDQHKLRLTKSTIDLNTALLEQVVRPAYIRSRPKDITAAGRKAIGGQSQAFTNSEEDEILKPWKHSLRYTVDILTWVISNSDAKTIEENWHLITPPVLTLLDDEDIPNKIKGCFLLQIILTKVPSKLWTRTGLGKVFEDALMPALAYLPPLTDQSDAEQLLKIIYPTLLSLCTSQFSSAEQQAKRIKMLDGILRSGILSGLSYCGENVKISGLLLAQLPAILSEMGIQSVKHLKVLIPVLIGYLCDPFASASPDLLQSAITSLQSTILNAWPRMNQYCGEIFKGVAVCWQRLSDEAESDSICVVKGELKTTIQLLRKALGESSKAEEMVTAIYEDERLRHLLP